MNGRGMVLHAGRRIERPGVTRTTTLCGRMNASSRDGMNIADTGEAVTCKFCLAKLRDSVPAVATTKALTTAAAALVASPRPSQEPSDDQ